MSSTRNESSRLKLYLLHRWTALLVAAVAMPVILSGAIATFHHEIDAWTGRGRPYPALAAVDGFDLDAAAAAAGAHVPERFRRHVDIRQEPGRPLSFFHYESVPGTGDVGVAVDVDPATLDVVRSKSGERLAAAMPPPAFTLGRFFLDLHVFLLLPRTLGLIVTGLAGLGLVALLATGVRVYPPTRANAVRKPRTATARIFTGNLHALVGIWSLPFTILTAVTGAFFSLAGAILLPLVALVAFGGDVETMIANMTRPIEVSRTGGVARLQPILDDAYGRSGGAGFSRVFLDDWRQEDATATVQLVDRSPWGDTSYDYVYDGHTGAFIQERVLLGTEPSLGSALFELVGWLHFGTLFGMVTKVLWGLFGLAAWGLAATGLLVFVGRQRVGWTAPDRVARGLAAALGGGLPLAAGAAAMTWAATVAFAAPQSYALVATAFVGTLVAAAAAGACYPMRRITMTTLAAAGLVFVTLPPVAATATGADVAEIWNDPARAGTLAVDAVLVLGGLVLMAGATLLRERKTPSARITCTAGAMATIPEAREESL